MIEIRTGDCNAAFDVPFEVYDKCTLYVSPMRSDFLRMLDPAKNPLSRDGHGTFCLFTAHRDGRPVGRIVATVHTASNRRHGTNRGQFGFFDCADDHEVADALVEASEHWLRAQGVDEIAGNFNLTAMQMAGVVTSGVENQPYTDMMWNPPHIAGHLTRLGYQATFPMTTFETDLTTVKVDVLLRPKQCAVLEDPDYTWHPITRRTFKSRMEDARLLLNDGFASNPMFVPVTKEEYDFQAGEMMWIMDPRLSVIVHYKGEPAGAIVCIPDLNPFVQSTRSRLTWTSPYHFLRHRLNRDRAVIVYYSVAQRWHGLGINGAMLYRLITQANSAGYKKLGGTWIADINKASLRQMEGLGATRLHGLHLFSKNLSGLVSGASS